MEKKELNPYGLFFIGESIEVEMATFTEKNEHGLNDVLIKVTGHAAFDEGIDQQVFRYIAVPAGTGVDFKYEQDGHEYTRMLSRQAWGTWTFFELFLNNKTYKVYKDEVRSKDVRPLHLLTDSKKTKAA